MCRKEEDRWTGAKGILLMNRKQSAVERGRRS